MNTQRTFDQIQIQRLGKYIYALRDPRDRKIFYTGQGIGNRVFDHFNEATAINTANVNLMIVSSKILRILDIWLNNEDVEWIIIAHNLPQDSNVADYIEAAVYDSLSESQNGETLNSNSPPKSSRLSPEDVIALAAEHVNPTLEIQNVFIFPIQNAVNSGATIYNATRAAWYVNANYRGIIPSVAVGLKNAISIGSYEVNQWIAATIDPFKHEFQSPNHPLPSDYQPLLNKNWTIVLDQAKGFWQ